MIGVYTLTDVRFAGEPWGFVFAFANCALFMAYVVLGHRIAQDGGTEGVDRLGAAMLVAAIAITPIGLVGALPTFSNLVLLGAGIGVGICSSVIPYVCDQFAMARLPRATFALLLALLPATAAVIGLVILGQVPTPPELVGIACIILGVAIHRDPPRQTHCTHRLGAYRQLLFDHGPFDSARSVASWQQPGYRRPPPGPHRGQE